MSLKILISRVIEIPDRQIEYGQREGLKDITFGLDKAISSSVNVEADIEEMNAVRFEFILNHTEQYSKKTQVRKNHRC